MSKKSENFWAVVLGAGILWWLFSDDAMTAEEQQAYWLEQHQNIISQADDLLGQDRYAAAEELIEDLPDADGPKMQALRARIEETKAAVEARRAEGKRQEEAFNTAVVVCQRLIKAQSKYPSKADFAWEIQGSFNTKTIMGRVEFMNGFGAMIPHVYRCNFNSNGEVTAAEVVGG